MEPSTTTTEEQDMFEKNQRVRIKSPGWVSHLADFDGWTGVVASTSDNHTWVVLDDQEEAITQFLKDRDPLIVWELVHSFTMTVLDSSLANEYGDAFTLCCHSTYVEPVEEVTT
jgi:hypothetical protein